MEHVGAAFSGGLCDRQRRTGRHGDLPAAVEGAARGLRVPRL
ncbi:hypothetical protein GL4_0505 [Methyloceanibacter caenitepidi]|uniref:Uncharacterized protein n=1 Tax=Methyloceanibacter caenitepidi TaxID=1384459 RepID=A0A0A8JZX2_9HYPH|nr:hypothetical protein GL4_0505 [Methyloceanibacter caenitepidi]